jgi:hypothetical protein
MAALQTYLHQAAADIRDAVLGGAQAPVQAPDASAYAMIYSHDRPPRAASKSEYLAAISDRANYEFLINAVELYCLKPRRRRHSTRAMTRSRRLMSGRFGTSWCRARSAGHCRPIGGYESERATDRSFQAARAKVDVKVGSATSSRSSNGTRAMSVARIAYEFAPPAGTRWLYVEPIVREPASE